MCPESVLSSQGSPSSCKGAAPCTGTNRAFHAGSCIRIPTVPSTRDRAHVCLPCISRGIVHTHVHRAFHAGSRTRISTNSCRPTTTRPAHASLQTQCGRLLVGALRIPREWSVHAWGAGECGASARALGSRTVERDRARSRSWRGGGVSSSGERPAPLPPARKTHGGGRWRHGFPLGPWRGGRDSLAQERP